MVSIKEKSRSVGRRGFRSTYGRLGVFMERHSQRLNTVFYL